MTNKKQEILPFPVELPANNYFRHLFGQRIGSVFVIAGRSLRTEPDQKNNSPNRKDKSTDQQNGKEKSGRRSDALPLRSGNEIRQPREYEQQDEDDTGQVVPQNDLSASVRVVQAANHHGYLRQEDKERKKEIEHALRLTENQLVEQHRRDHKQKRKQDEIPVLAAARASFEVRIITNTFYKPFHTR